MFTEKLVEEGRWGEIDRNQRERKRERKKTARDRK
jgi:hypothetical protein